MEYIIIQKSGMPNSYPNGETIVYGSFEEALKDFDPEYDSEMKEIVEG